MLSDTSPRIRSSVVLRPPSTRRERGAEGVVPLGATRVRDVAAVSLGSRLHRRLHPLVAVATLQVFHRASRALVARVTFPVAVRGALAEVTHSMPSFRSWQSP